MGTIRGADPHLDSVDLPLLVGETLVLTLRVPLPAPHAELVHQVLVIVHAVTRC